MVGQGRAAVLRTLGASRRHRTVDARARNRSQPCPQRPRCAVEEIKFQVALITPLYHVKGAAAPETKIAVERARLLIEEAEALGEPPEDPLLLFSVLYGFWVVNLVAFNGGGCANSPRNFWHSQRSKGDGAAHGRPSPYECLLDTYGRLRGSTSARRSSARALRSSEHRPLVARFGQDIRVAILAYQALALWFLGYPDAALAATDQTIRDAREIGDAATLMYGLIHASMVHSQCGIYSVAEAETVEEVALGERKRQSILDGVRDARPRLPIGRNRQSL